MSEWAAVPKALQEVSAAAHAGDIDAQALLAQCLSEGRGVERDEAEAMHWYALAANSGHVVGN